jgi:8-oxo-dGTP pyrophosphatase MutT (NUDIX family)
MSSVSPARFYAGVVAFVWEPLQDLYLIVQRSRRKDYAPGEWWVVTGTVKHGEGFADALHREVHEELATAIRDYHLLETTHFFQGPVAPENEWLSASFLCTLANPAALRLNHEHVGFRWVTGEEFVAVIGQASHPVDWMLHGLQLAEKRKTSLPRHGRA